MSLNIPTVLSVGSSHSPCLYSLSLHYCSLLWRRSLAASPLCLKSCAHLGWERELRNAALPLTPRSLSLAWSPYKSTEYQHSSVPEPLHPQATASETRHHEKLTGPCHSFLYLVTHCTLYSYWCQAFCTIPNCAHPALYFHICHFINYQYIFLFCISLFTLQYLLFCVFFLSWEYEIVFSYHHQNKFLVLFVHGT